MGANAIVLLTIALVVIALIYCYNATVSAKEDFVGAVAKKITDAAFSSVVSENGKPILWFVVDDYGTNNRRWIDFSSRSSRDLNMGFLALTKSRCLMTQGTDFDVRFLLGREAVASAVIAADGIIPSLHMSLLPSLWRAWARSALMRYCGGLYMDGLSLCLGPSFMTCVKGKDDAVFGTEHDEPRTSALDGSCSPFASWSSGPGHKAWTELNKDIVDLADGGDLTWTAAVARNQISQWHGKHLRTVPCLRTCEWSRLNSGKPIELEDLFGRSYNLNNEYVPSAQAVYLPLDYEKIDRSVTYKWFLLLPVEQIISSDFLWAKLSTKQG